MQFAEVEEVFKSFNQVIKYHYNTIKILANITEVKEDE